MGYEHKIDGVLLLEQNIKIFIVLTLNMRDIKDRYLNDQPCCERPTCVLSIIDTLDETE